MKDSQHFSGATSGPVKYIKANNERFSTVVRRVDRVVISISRRIMKDSQPDTGAGAEQNKYIKANNERFSTDYVAQAQAR